MHFQCVHYVYMIFLVDCHHTKTDLFPNIGSTVYPIFTFRSRIEEMQYFPIYNYQHISIRNNFISFCNGKQKNTNKTCVYTPFACIFIVSYINTVLLSRARMMKNKLLDIFYSEELLQLQLQIVFDEIFA